VEVSERFVSGFGGSQAILRMESGAYLGASDPRKDGQAVGF
jgi:gamma-glutamyltranspeptidase